MEKQKAASGQQCELQIKEMTDTLAKYQQENSKLVAQKDKEIETLRQSMSEMQGYFDVEVSYSDVKLSYYCKIIFLISQSCLTVFLLCRLQSIAAGRNHFVRYLSVLSSVRLCVCPIVILSW